jgi:predicted enzyme related to lactoylglutathione lyase
MAHGGKVISEPHDYHERGRQAMLSDREGAVFAVLSSSTGDPPDVMAAPGSWIWSSLITRDPDAAAAFYQTLFGYDVFDSGSGENPNPLQFASNGYARACANVLPGDPARHHPHWLNYVRVVDAPAAVAKAVELGGRVLVEPRPHLEGGRMAVVADPAGAPIGLFEWTGSDNGKEKDTQ